MSRFFKGDNLVHGWQMPGVHEKIAKAVKEKVARGEYQYKTSQFDGKRGKYIRRIIIKDYTLYQKLRTLLGKRVIYYGSGVDCPFCGKRVYRSNRQKKGMTPLESHLRGSCRKTPWYWAIVKANLEKWKACKKAGKPYISKFNRDTPINKYVKQFGCKNLKQYVHILMGRPIA